MGETVHVEIVEDDDGPSLLPADRPAPGEAPETRPRRRGRRPAWIAAGGIVAVVLAVGGGAALLDERREQTRWDALEEAGWPLVDLSEPLAEVWRSDGGWLLTQEGDTAVLETYGSRPSYRAVDVGTGETVWELPMQGDEWCQPWYRQGAVREPYDAMNLGGLATTGVVVCLPGGGWDGTPVPPGTGTSVRSLDIAAGSERGVATVSGRFLGMEMDERGLVVVTVRESGTLGVARVELPEVRIAWDTTTDVLPDPEYLWNSPVLGDGIVRVVDATGAVQAVLDDETGVVTDDAPGELDPGVFAASLLWPDGSTVSLQREATGAGVGSGLVVTGPDGDERFSVVGDLVLSGRWDGSFADRLLVVRAQGDGVEVAALDMETGEEIWTRPTTTVEALFGAVAQVDGVLLTAGETMAALDVRTGETLWSMPAPYSFGMSVVTDGTRVLVPGSEAGESFVSALDLRSGAEVWRMPVEGAGTSWSPLPGGTVIATGDSGLVAYR